MELKADLWFPSIIFAGINDVIDRGSIKQIAQAWRNKEPDLAGNSNEGVGIVVQLKTLIYYRQTYNKFLIQWLLNLIKQLTLVAITLAFLP